MIPCHSVIAGDGDDEPDISDVKQNMCRSDYNVSNEPYFKLNLLPGTTFACVSIFLNLAVFLTFMQMRTASALPSSSRSTTHFSLLALLNIFVGVAFVISQIHALGYNSYDDLYHFNAQQPICIENKTHHLNLIFTVFETSRKSGRVIKGYSILRYFFELMDRFGNAYLAVDRTLIVCFPMTYGLRKQRASDVSTTKEFVTWSVVPPMLFTFGVVVLLAATKVLKCIYELFFFMLVVLELPLLPLFICAIVLLIKSCLGRGENPPLVRDGIRNLSQMTLALVIVFIFCDIPNLVFQIGLWAGISVISDSGSKSYFLYNNIQHVARLFSCFFHFFIYFTMSGVFRHNLKVMLKGCFCSRGRSDAAVETGNPADKPATTANNTTSCACAHPRIDHRKSAAHLIASAACEDVELKMVK